MAFDNFLNKQVLMTGHHIRKIKKNKGKATTSLIDILVYIAIIVSPALTLPQVYSIWVEGQKGVSLISWEAYLIAAIIWLLYGLKHQDKPIIVVQTIWIILDTMIIIGVMRLG